MPTRSPLLDLVERLTPARISAIAMIFLALLAGGTVAIVVDSDPSPPATTTPTETTPASTTVDSDADGKRDDVLPLGAPAQAELKKALTATDEPGDTHRELAGPLREPNDPSRTAPGVLQGPLAAQEFPGCRTRFVGNYSSRNGAAIRAIILHQTVSRERGLASQNALTAYANRRSSGVSWHFLIGPTNGLCTFTVPLNMKAWTQGNANPFSIGIEVERYGDEPTYVAGAGERKLVAVLRELGRRFNIPMRRGRVVNCRVVRSGILEHSELGACGGGHADVTPWSTDPIIAKAAAGSSAQTIAAAKARGKTCNQLRYHRKKTHPWPATRTARVKVLKQRAKALGLDERRCRA